MKAKQAIQAVIGLGLAAVLLIWGLPYFAKTSWADIWGVVRHIPWHQVLIFQALMLAGLYCYTFPFTGSLRGLSHARALIDETWPEPDREALAQDTVEIVVQVNGKLRGRIAVPAGAEQPAVLALALADADVQRFVAGVTPRKVVYVAGKLLNLVI